MEFKTFHYLTTVYFFRFTYNPIYLLRQSYYNLFIPRAFLIYLYSYFFDYVPLVLNNHLTRPVYTSLKNLFKKPFIWTLFFLDWRLNNSSLIFYFTLYVYISALDIKHFKGRNDLTGYVPMVRDFVHKHYSNNKYLLNGIEYRITSDTIL